MSPGATIDALTPLLGAWRGEGVVEFPTISTFDYRETLRFERDPARPLVHYEQRTEEKRRGSDRWEPSHWEAGFLRALAPNLLEMTNAQDGGRLEITRLRLVCHAHGLELTGESVAVFNDPRIVRVERSLTLREGVLRYDMRMATTAVDAVTPHLSATLERA